jgi:hypothetical protein
MTLRPLRDLSITSGLTRADIQFRVSGFPVVFGREVQLFTVSYRTDTGIISYHYPQLEKLLKCLKHHLQTA